MKSFRDVVLPAPFDPSNPVMPSPISKLTPSSARTEPYDFVTSSARSRGAMPPERIRGDSGLRAWG